MSRQLSVAVENNFSKGLITEATALNFPENACTDTLNCVFHRTGEVTRRLGIELEDAFDSFENDFTGKAVTEYLWESVGQNGDVVMFVLQVGTTVSFFGLDSVGSLSPTIKSFEVDLADYAAPGASSTEIQEDHAQFCSGYGMLWITHPHTDPIQVEYDSEEDDVTKTKLTLRVRDVDGVPNNSALTGIPLEFNVRPIRSQVSEVILYNLYNQGWSVKTACTSDGKHWDKGLHPLVMWTGGYDFVIPLFGPTYSRTDSPSEGDAWWSMKATILPGIDENGNAVPPIPPPEGFSLQGVDRIGQPLAPAGKGHFLLNAFAEDRVEAVNTDVNTPYPLDGTNWNRTGNLGVAFYDRNAGKNRPAACAFHAGRIFYAGVSHEKYTGDIFFSQIMERNRNAERCYQHNDPTNEGVTDLLPNDGGIVRIPLMARCVTLISVGANLIAFATNGVWRIGSAVEASGGFSANDYTVSRLSDVGCISPLSFVKTDQGIMWWNHDGLWALTQDPTAGIKVVNLALSTIQTYIDDLPSTEFRWVKGAFNPVSKIVQWLHRTTTSDTIEERYEYDRILNLDTTTGAFYPWSIPDTCMKVVGMEVIKGVGAEISAENVVDNSDVDVTDLTGEIVTVDVTTQTDLSSRFKYVVRNDCEALAPTDPGEEDTGITLNPDFKGHATTATVGTVTRSPSQNGMVIGEDNEIYVISVSSGTTHAVRFAGVNEDAETIPLATLKTDVTTATGISIAAWNNFAVYQVVVPYTQYFYSVIAGYTGSVYVTFFGLYKINSSGNIEFVAAQAYQGSPFSFNYSGLVYSIATDFKGYPVAGESPLDKTLISAIANLTSIVSGSSSAVVIELPSVNEFIAGSGTDNGAGSWADLVNPGISGLSWKFFFTTGASYQPDDSGATNNMFFLPISATDSMLCKYVSRAIADYHNDNHPNLITDTTIASFSASNPNGFVIGAPLSTGVFSVISNSFRDSGGGALIPFADMGLNKLGAAGNEYYDDYTSCNVQNDWTNGLTYAVWVKRYENIATNQEPLGSYAKIILQSWDPNTQIATFIDEADSNPYDTVAEGIVPSELSRYGTYPFVSFALFNPNISSIYVFHALDSTHGAGGFEYILAKFGDFAAPTIESSPVSLMFAEYNNTDNVDWEQSLGGEDYISHFTTGYKLRGEGMRKWQDNYLSIFSKPDDVRENSVFDIHAKWDYANVGDTGRWSVTQRVTIDDTEYDYGIKRLKVRGHGKAMQFKVASVDTEPFSIIGWASWDSANAKP